MHLHVWMDVFASLSCKWVHMHASVHMCMPLGLNARACVYVCVHASMHVPVRERLQG